MKYIIMRMKNIYLLLLLMLPAVSFAQNKILYEGGPSITMPSRGYECNWEENLDGELEKRYIKRYYEVNGVKHLEELNISANFPGLTSPVVYTVYLKADYYQLGILCPSNKSIQRTQLEGSFTVTIIPFYWQALPSRCVNGASVNLAEYISYSDNVSYSGAPGISGGILTPEHVGDGEYVITASRTFDNGLHSVSTKITILPTYAEQESTQGSMWLVNSLGLCEDGTGVNLTERVRFYNSSTDGFSWPGGTGTVFNPASLGQGEYTITYTYMNGYNCVSEHELAVKIDPTFTIDVGGDEDYCLDAPTFTLPNSNAGNWSGPGVSNEQFTPSSAGAGPHTVIFTQTVGVCTKTAEKDIYIYPLPSVNAGADLEFCKDGGVKELQTAGVSPTNGTWEFLNTSLNSRINNIDKTVDITGMPVDSYDLKYSYTNNNGCYNEDFRKIKINDVLTAPFLSDDSYNCGPGKIFLTIKDPQSSVNYQWYDGEFDASPIMIGTSYQTPILNETTSYWISSINSQGCESEKRQVFAEIRDIPSIYAGPKQYTCFEGDVIELSGGNPSEGTYSGTHVTNNTFDPKGLPSGAYSITYTATVNGCQGQGTKEVIIRENVAIDAGANKRACFGTGVVNLNDLNVYPSNGTWKFVNSSLNFALDSSFVDVDLLQPSSSGYLVEYSVTDTMGCRSSDTKLLIVDSQPETPVVLSEDRCGSGHLNFTVSNLNTLNTYNWYEDTTSTTPLKTGQSFYSPYLTESVTFYVQSINSNGCKSLKASFAAEVFPNPDFTFTPNVLLCLNTSEVDLNQYVDPVGGWYSGTGVSGDKFYPTIAGEGAHLVEYTYTNQFGCTLTEGFQITVTGSINDNLIGNDTSFCKSHEPIYLPTWTTIQGGTFYGPGVEFNVFTPSEVSTNALSISFEYEEDGCVFKDDREITLLSSPSTPTIQGDGEGCEGDILEFSTTKVSNLTYNWYLDDDRTVFATSQNINVTVGEVENVYLETVNQVGCPSFDRAHVLIVNKNPIGSFSATPTVLNIGEHTKFTWAGSNGASYKWHFGDGDYSMEKHPAHYYYQADSFDVSVIVTSSLGCKDTFTVEKYIVVNGQQPQIPLDQGQAPINALVKNLDLISYPNPVTDRYSLVFGQAGDYSIQVVDLSGKILLQEKITGKEAQIDFSTFPAGSYILQVKGDSINKSIQVQKQ